MFPVRYELDFFIPEDDILRSQRRENSNLTEFNHPLEVGELRQYTDHSTNWKPGERGLNLGTDQRFVFSAESVAVF
jgi:hypothetical protein